MGEVVAVAAAPVRAAAKDTAVTRSACGRLIVQNADAEAKAQLVGRVLTKLSRDYLIEQFVDSLTVDADVDDSWHAYVAAARTKELDQIIAEENLRPRLAGSLYLQARLERAQGRGAATAA